MKLENSVDKVHVIWMENIGDGRIRPNMDSLRAFDNLAIAKVYIKGQIIEDLYDTFGENPREAGLLFRRWEDVPFDVLSEFYLVLRFPLGMFEIF
jgi:hypothetical protein